MAKSTKARTFKFNAKSHPQSTSLSLVITSCVISKVICIHSHLMGKLWTGYWASKTQECKLQNFCYGGLSQLHSFPSKSQAYQKVGCREHNQVVQWRPDIAIILRRGGVYVMIKGCAFCSAFIFSLQYPGKNTRIALVRKNDVLLS